MKLGSARELKAALREGILEGLADALRREGALVTAASRAAAAVVAPSRTAICVTAAGT